MRGCTRGRSEICNNKSKGIKKPSWKMKSFITKLV